MSPAWLLGLLLAACQDLDDAARGPLLADAVAPQDSDCADAVPTDGAFLGVTVLDDQGRGVDADGVDVRWCRDGACAVPACVEGHVFHLGGLAAGTGGLVLRPRGASAETVAASFATVELHEEGSLAVTVRLAPLLSRPLPPQPAEVEVAPGVFVTVGRGDVLGGDGRPVVAVGGAELTAQSLPVRGPPGDVVRVVGLGPFEAVTACEVPGGDGCQRRRLAVRVEDRWGVGAAGLVLWAADPSAGRWERVGVLQPDGSGSLTLRDGPNRLTTWLLTRA